MFKIWCTYVHNLQPIQNYQGKNTNHVFYAFIIEQKL